MKFLLTRELGRLAKWLRILGFDSRYLGEVSSGSLIIEALREERVILTRNHRLPKSCGVKIIVLEAEKIKEQVQEALNVLKIQPESDKMFRRCILCNEELAETEKENIKDKVPEYVYKTQENFLTCPKCKRIYWQGTHWGNVVETLKDIGKQANR
jgi:uncharacterized protein with PIN domain